MQPPLQSRNPDVVHLSGFPCQVQMDPSAEVRQTLGAVLRESLGHWFPRVLVGFGKTFVVVDNDFQ